MKHNKPASDATPTTGVDANPADSLTEEEKAQIVESKDAPSDATQSPTEDTSKKQPLTDEQKAEAKRRQEAYQRMITEGYSSWDVPASDPKNSPKPPTHHHLTPGA